MPNDWTVGLVAWPLCDCWRIRAPDGRCFNRFDPVDGKPSSYVEVPVGKDVLDPRLRRQIDEAIEAWDGEPDDLSDLVQTE